MKLRRHWLLWLLLLLLLLLFVALGLLRWGGYLLVSSDPLPPHADVAIVLQGSVLGEIARVAGAAQLLRQGTAAQALLSVPKQSYWGQSVPDAARAYIERRYGSAISNQVVFCETGPEVDSTEQEAESLREYIHERGWREIIIVTSDYHTRRAGRIWRSVLKGMQPPVQMWVNGVDDPEFQPRGWWRKRLWAKTWFYEVTKLIAEAF